MLRSWHIWYLGGIWAIVSVGMDGLIFWIPLLIKCAPLVAAPPQPMLDGHAKHRACHPCLMEMQSIEVASQHRDETMQDNPVSHNLVSHN